MTFPHHFETKVERLFNGVQAPQPLSENPFAKQIELARIANEAHQKEAKDRLDEYLKLVSIGYFPQIIQDAIARQQQNKKEVQQQKAEERLKENHELISNVVQQMFDYVITLNLPGLEYSQKHIDTIRENVKLGVINKKTTVAGDQGAGIWLLSDELSRTLSDLQNKNSNLEDKLKLFNGTIFEIFNIIHNQ
jgi:hypothetical protein